MKYSWKKHCVLVLAVSLVSACSNGGSGAGGVGDTQPPTDPSNLVATAASVNQIDLTWTAATDNVGVTGYQILRDGAVIATTVSTTYTDSGLAMSSLHTYTVKAGTCPSGGLLSSSPWTMDAPHKNVSDVAREHN